MHASPDQLDDNVDENNDTYANKDIEPSQDSFCGHGGNVGLQHSFSCGLKKNCHIFHITLIVKSSSLNKNLNMLICKDALAGEEL